MAGGIRLTSKGDFKKTEQFLKFATNASKNINLDKYGQKGVAALASATPVDTGLTAKSWNYKVEKSGSTISLVFYNTNVVSGVPIAIILQYGHGTGTGGWVEGRDYINPAIRPIFDEMADAIWKEVTRK